MPFVICKLPHGLSIKHNGQTINLNGANEGYDPAFVAPNGKFNDGERRTGGFGITEISPEQFDAFNDWSDKVTFNDGDKTKGKLVEPNLALENGLIVAFKSEGDARKEAKNLAGYVTTGTEGIDPATDAQMKADGLETADKTK
jgi:hypothetical protein